ncbi:MAG: HDOD domain-containing protein [Pseudomonadales bacterium]
MDDRLLKRLTACRDLPSLPAAAAHIVELAQDDTASMGAVADAVKMDPALAAKVLRIANSPLYGQRRQSDNLSQAVLLLGLNATLTLALSFSLVSAFRASPPNGFDYGLFWRRSLLAATAARVIAKTTRQAPSEDCFLAALLQDIGLLALMKAQPDLYNDLDAAQQRDHALLMAYESERLDADHAEIGAWLLAQWHFPERLMQAVSASHDVAGTTDDNPLVQIVRLSGHIADMLLPDPNPAAWQQVRALVPPAWQVGDEWLDSLIPLLDDEVPVIEELFDIPLLDGADIASLLADAREAELMHHLKNVQELELVKQTTASLQHRVREIEAQNRIDALTGLYNRGHLDELLISEFDHAVRHHWPLSLIFVDLDYFKQINDTYGHDVGDAALRQVAQLLVQATRETDLVARYGGEEFILVLPGVAADTAKEVGDRIVAAFHDVQVQTEAHLCFSLTVSAGVATHDEYTPFADVATLLRAADRAMYSAKLQGRDRLIRWQPSAA